MLEVRDLRLRSGHGQYRLRHRSRIVAVLNRLCTDRNLGYLANYWNNNRSTFFSDLFLNNRLLDNLFTCNTGQIRRFLNIFFHLIIVVIIREMSFHRFLGSLPRIFLLLQLYRKWHPFARFRSNNLLRLTRSRRLVQIHGRPRRVQLLNRFARPRHRQRKWHLATGWSRFR
uniref:(northern house mosquito) hypothetical protein n=1 Tax=Culex pipiens TaxID=7175 RepID=A0A8D8AR98_CULPI